MMKPYKIIEGTSQAIELFEKKIAEALAEGYDLAGELVAHPHSAEIKFYQPLILSEEAEEDWDEDEEDEDDEEDEEDD